VPLEKKEEEKKTKELKVDFKKLWGRHMELKREKSNLFQLGHEGGVPVRHTIDEHSTRGRLKAPILKRQYRPLFDELNKLKKDEKINKIVELLNEYEDWLKTQNKHILSEKLN
jgi:hypothetical protein